MNNKLLFLLFFILFFVKNNAQNISIDSLNVLATSYACKDIKKSDSLSKIVLARANHKNQLNKIGIAYKNLGKNLLCQQKLDESIEFINKAVSSFKKSGNKNEYAKTINNLCVALRYKGEHDRALELCREQVVIATQIKNDTILASAYGVMSGIYSNKELIDSTAIYASKSLKIAKKNNLKDLVWKMTFSLGAASQGNKDFEKAIDYYKDLEPLLMEMGNYNYIGMLYNNMGGCYLGLKQFDKAEEVYAKNLLLSKENKHQHYTVVSNSGLAHVYSDLDNYTESNKYYLKTLEGAQNLGTADIIVDALSNLCNNYYQQKKYKKAKEYGFKALEYAKEKGFVKKEIETYKYLFLTNKGLDNTKEALKYLELYKEKEEERLAKEKSNTILELQTKYEVEKKELLAENALKEKQIAEEKSKENRNYFLGSLIIGGLILLSSITYISKTKANKKAELITLELKETQKRLALEKQYRHSELKALKAQMDPHFIFNALNSIQEYIILNQKNLASDYLGKFADLMRKYLNHSDKGIISLQEEIECLNMYLELETIRFEDKLSYQIDVQNKIGIENILIPTMLIQPYVENALKHGLLHKKNKGLLKISFDKLVDKQVLICSVEDNGVGRVKAQELKEKRSILHKSFATKATESRLNLLNYGKEEQIGVEYEDLIDDSQNASGTKVYITIPFTNIV